MYENKKTLTKKIEESNACWKKSSDAVNKNKYGDKV